DRRVDGGRWLVPPPSPLLFLFLLLLLQREEVPSTVHTSTQTLIRQPLRAWTVRHQQPPTHRPPSTPPCRFWMPNQARTLAPWSWRLPPTARGNVRLISLPKRPLASAW